MNPAMTIESGNLPEKVRLFPLTQTILLPRAIVSLNVFEPRYLAMVREALASDQIVAMIQPRAEGTNELYDVGTAGRIVQHELTDDGRILIDLKGACRFRLIEEIESSAPWRTARVDYDDFPGDGVAATDTNHALTALANIERAHLEDELRQYLARQNLTANWDSIRTADDESLIATLCTACPFQVSERQALLEARGFAERAQTLVALLRLADGNNNRWVH